MAKFEREIKDEEVMLFLGALAWKYGYEKEVQSITPSPIGGVEYSVVPNPESIQDFVGRKVDEEWKQLVRDFQKEMAHKQLDEVLDIRNIEIK